MANVLYLVHRLPYPPDKGDKVRSYHVLRHLAERHSVFLGTFTENSDDERHLPTLRAMCADVFAARLNPLSARLTSLRGLFRGEPLTLSYYRDAALARWVDGVILKHRIDTTMAFSSSMAQYAQSDANGRRLVDFVDVDSAKWSGYAESHPWPLSWLYRREGHCLLAYERQVAIQSTRAFFVTDKESQLFCRLAPECAGVVETLSNGVDTSFFACEPDRASPFEADETPLVFTGAMDYWPNVDAVTWFAAEILPELRRRWSNVRLHIVGRDPTTAVLALESASVRVSGTVPDVRPYLQHAAVVVASLRLARGIQNKILEAMAMARPVVASTSCAEALQVGVEEGLMAATTVDDYVREIDALLRSRERADHVGQAARRCVLERYTWDAHLSGLDQYVPGGTPTNKERQ
jgi:sugar transferase (PEP-CTERM/EpsH1 system associated)